MGVLEDAIRQHLELKRQHGAAEEEVEKQAQEALGPVRRDQVAPEDEAAADAVAEAPEAVPGAEPEADASTDLFDAEAAPPAAPEPDPSVRDALAADIAAPAEPPAAEAPVDPPLAPPGAVEPPPEPVDEGPALEEAPGAEEAPLPDAYEDEPALEQAAGALPIEQGPAEPEPAGWLDEDEADEVLPEEALDSRTAEPAEGEEDVLEETPDFLQETPEHDRLWFEQKPPRDFDFD